MKNKYLRLTWQADGLEQSAAAGDLLSHGALRAHYRDRFDVHVRGDMFIYYRSGNHQINVVPDVSGGVEVPQTSYRVWEVGVVTKFVKVASESTQLLDRGEKAGEYARIGVREYWRFDATGELVQPPVYGACSGRGSRRGGGTSRWSHSRERRCAASS